MLYDFSICTVTQNSRNDKYEPIKLFYWPDTNPTNWWSCLQANGFLRGLNKLTSLSHRRRFCAAQNPNPAAGVGVGKGGDGGVRAEEQRGCRPGSEWLAQATGSSAASSAPPSLHKLCEENPQREAPWFTVSAGAQPEGRNWWHVHCHTAETPVFMTRWWSHKKVRQQNIPASQWKNGNLQYFWKEIPEGLHHLIK